VFFRDEGAVTRADVIKKLRVIADAAVRSSRVSPGQAVAGLDVLPGERDGVAELRELERDGEGTGLAVAVRSNTRNRYPKVVAVETPAHDLTIFKLHCGGLTLKIYSKGERVLRIESIAHNTIGLDAMGDGRSQRVLFAHVASGGEVA
jgi:hypothetical protein